MDGIDREEMMEMLYEIIDEFEEETGLDRDEFVIVMNPECPLYRTEKGGMMEVIDGVGVVTNTKIHYAAVSLMAREHLDEINEVIEDMGLDQPPPSKQKIIMRTGGKLEVVDIDDDDVIEAVECYNCGHPISVLNSADYIFVTCPWCNKENEIE